MRGLCAGDEVPAGLGPARPSELAAGFLLVKPTRCGSSIEWRPVGADEFGIALLTLQDPGSWGLADLDAWAGPFAAVPVMPGTGRQVQGQWAGPALPARASLYLTVDRDPADPRARVLEVRIRVEPD